MALVQKNGGTTNGSTSIVTSLGSATTAGNTILIFANGAGTITTPSGFTSRSPQVNTQGLYLFEKLVASGNSSDTPTLTMSGPYNATWQIVEYSGITAFDVSSGNNSGGVGSGSYSTPSITPTTGARLLVAFVAATNSSNTGTFSAGDPQSWTNSFTGQRSDTRTGITGSGRDSMVGGFADRSGVTGNGSTTYSTAASMTSSTGALAPASIIASYKVTAGGTAYTLTAAQGTFSLSGQPASLRSARQLSAAVGSFALSGKAATLRYGYKLTASAGGFALSGVAANFKRTYALAASTGSFVLSGKNAGLAFGHKLPAATGSFSLSGQTAALRFGRNLVAGTGSFGVAGQSATLRAGRKITAGTGAFALTGNSANLVYSPIGTSYTLTASAGSFALSGQSASLRIARKLVAASGSYGLTGQAAGLRAARKITAASGAFAVSGQAASLRAVRRLNALKGSFTLVGIDAALIKSGGVSYTLIAETGSLVLSGQPATLTYMPLPGIRNPLERLKMYTGSMGSVSNREDWIVNISLVGDDGTSFDLTGANIVTYVCREGNADSPVLSASLSNGIVLTDDYTMQWHFSEEQMAALCPQQYDVFCRVERDDITTQLLAANIAVVDGGPA